MEEFGQSRFDVRDNFFTALHVLELGTHRV